MKRGFSTLEILIAMAILVSGFVAVILLSTGQSLTSDAQIATEALSAARKAIESEQSLSRKDFKLVVASSSPNAIAGIVSTTSITVVQQDTFTKKVTATVMWKGSYGRDQSVSLATLVSNFGSAVGGDTCSSVLSDTNGNHSNWKAPLSSATLLSTIVGDTGAAQYPVTDIDAYQGRTYVGVSTTTSPVGPNNPSSGIDSSVLGTISWNSPSRVTAKDGNNATLALSGTSVSHYLKATNFGFAIPPGSTIQGIKVDIVKTASGQSGSNAVVDSQVKIVKADGSIGVTNKASGSTWGTSQFTATYGSASDYWGESDWTPAKINNSNFGVVLAVTGAGSSANRTASVDSIQVTVYYTKELYILKNPADTANPSAPTFLGGLATSTQTGGINALVVATSSTSNLLYAATGSATGLNQLQIIDVTDPAQPFVRGSFPTIAGTGMGQGVGNSIFYKDGYAYVGLTKVGSGPEFNIIDVSTPTVPVWKGGYTVGNYVNQIYVKDGYAYLTTNDPAREVVILNVTNPALPTLAASYNETPDVTNFGFGRGVYATGDLLYLGRSWTNSSSIPQFLTLGTSALPATTLGVVKALGTNLSLNSIIVRDYLVYLLLGSQSSGGQVQIISATSTVAWGSLPAVSFGATGLGGTSMDCEGNYIFTSSIDSAGKATITAITGQ